MISDFFFVLIYRTLGPGCLNATRIIIADAAGRLSFTYPGGFNVCPDPCVWLHARTVFSAQVDQIRLQSPKKKKKNPIKEKLKKRNFKQNPYRSRSNVEIGRFVIVHFLKRQTCHENLESIKIVLKF